MVFRGFYFKTNLVKHPFIFPTKHWNEHSNEWKLDILFLAKSVKRKVLSSSYLAGFWHEETVLRDKEFFY